MDCLITKLKGTVEDSNLLKLNEARISIFPISREGNNYIILKGIDTVRTLNGENIISATLGGPYTNKVSISPDSGIIYLDNNSMELYKEYIICVENKYNIKNLVIGSPFALGGDANFINYLPALEGVILICNNAVGNVKFSSSLKTFGTYGSREKYSSLNLFLNLKSILDNCTMINNLSNNVTYEVDQDTVDITNTSLTSITGEVLTDDNFSRVFTCRLNTPLPSLTNCTIPFHNVYVTTDAIKGCINLTSFDKTNPGSLTCDGDLIDALSYCKKLNRKSLNLVDFKGTIEQTLNKVPECYYYMYTGSLASDNAPFVWTTPSPARSQILTGRFHMKSGTALYIKDMAKLNLAGDVQDYQKVIAILSDDLTSSTASSDSELQEAIETLTGKGVTVTLTYSDVETNSISLMSKRAVSADKYAIVIRNNKLVVEPTNISRSIVKAAYDCVYKEFSSVEEANDYIKSNGLKKAESI